MADTQTQAKDPTTTPAEAPVRQPEAAAATRLIGVWGGSDSNQLSLGQWKHLRGQQDAGEAMVTDPRPNLTT